MAGLNPYFLAQPEQFESAYTPRAHGNRPASPMPMSNDMLGQYGPFIPSGGGIPAPVANPFQGPSAPEPMANNTVPGSGMNFMEGLSSAQRSGANLGSSGAGSAAGALIGNAIVPGAGAVVGSLVGTGVDAIINWASSSYESSEYNKVQADNRKFAEKLYNDQVAREQEQQQYERGIAADTTRYRRRQDKKAEAWAIKQDQYSKYQQQMANFTNFLNSNDSMRNDLISAYHSLAKG